MNYKKSLEYLENLTIYGIKTGVEHTKILAEGIGNPHNSFPSILISGTNGKGSTAAYLESILKQNGYKTGLFTSPHLIDVRERIRVNGELISKKLFSYAISKVKEKSLQLKKKKIIDEDPTFFEVLTLAAFQVFKEEGIDIAVVEVGMGGRNDCTNILDPVVSVVTNVSFDHQQYLGKTLKDISFEKSGIFRKERWALVGKTSFKVNQYLKNGAIKKGAKYISLREGKIVKEDNGYLLKIQKKEMKFPTPPLIGKHQITNVALSVLICEKLKELGYKINEESIKNGIKKCKWEGRIQKVMKKPDTYLDGAHNIDGIKCLKDFIKSLKQRKKVLLFGALKDKPIKKMVKIVEPFFNEIIFTRIEMKRGARKEDYEKIDLNRKLIFIKDPFKALKKAREKAGVKGVVVVCGSLYLVGKILEKLKNKKMALWGTGL